MTRGHRGSLHLRCRAFPSPPPCRFIPAHAPSLHRDYRRFSTTTSRSASRPRDGTQRLTVPAAGRAPSKAGIANAKLAYQAYEQTFTGTRWQSLAADGAHKQRPLWASTGVKDPEYDDTMYVTQLIAPDTVNTMPEATLRAVEDHGVITGPTANTGYDEARKVFSNLTAAGIEIDDVTELLETEGVSKFMDSWSILLEGVQKQLNAAAGERSEP